MKNIQRKTAAIAGVLLFAAFAPGADPATRPTTKPTPTRPFPQHETPLGDGPRRGGPGGMFGGQRGGGLGSTRGFGEAERRPPTANEAKTTFVVEKLPPALASALTVEAYTRLGYEAQIDYSTALEGRVLAVAVTGDRKTRKKRFVARWHLVGDGLTRITLEDATDDGRLANMKALLQRVLRARELPEAKAKKSWLADTFPVPALEQAREVLAKQGFLLKTHREDVKEIGNNRIEFIDAYAPDLQCVKIRIVFPAPTLPQDKISIDFISSYQGPRLLELLRLMETAVEHTNFDSGTAPIQEQPATTNPS